MESGETIPPATDGDKAMNDMVNEFISQFRTERSKRPPTLQREHSIKDHAKVCQDNYKHGNTYRAMHIKIIIFSSIAWYLCDYFGKEAAVTNPYTKNHHDYN